MGLLGDILGGPLYVELTCKSRQLKDCGIETISRVEAINEPTSACSLLETRNADVAQDVHKVHILTDSSFKNYPGLWRMERRIGALGEPVPLQQ